MKRPTLRWRVVLYLKVMGEQTFYVYGKTKAAARRVIRANTILAKAKIRSLEVDTPGEWGAKFLADHNPARETRK